MKFNQIPAIHSIITRWRQPQTGKSASDPALDAPADSNSHSLPVRTPPSPKSPSKKSVRIFEVESPPRQNSSVKGKGREVVAERGPAASMPQLPSPPPSPLLNRRSRSNRCCSGEPVTHSQIGEIVKKCGPVHLHERFECEDAVDPAIYTCISDLRANRWEYTVSKRGKSGYTVKVDYSAGAVFVTGDGAHDPQKPVAVDIAKTKGINGLMTVTSRH
ncbi:hypothetical protein B0J17DRAFT_687678 [Rhizoctonia solani]|nr:hypothetical protein B0J17DRAFT_687678 [Rhizoctonia solani]